MNKHTINDTKVENGFILNSDLFVYLSFSKTDHVFWPLVCGKVNLKENITLLSLTILKSLTWINQ